MFNSDIWYQISLHLILPDYSNGKSIYNLMLVCRQSLKGVLYLFSLSKNNYLANGIKHGKFVNTSENIGYFCGNIHGIHNRYLRYVNYVDFYRGVYNHGTKIGIHYNIIGDPIYNEWEVDIEYNYTNSVIIYKYKLNTHSDDYSYSSIIYYNSASKSIPSQKFRIDNSIMFPKEFLDFFNNSIHNPPNLDLFLDNDKYSKDYFYFDLQDKIEYKYKLI